MDERIGEEFIRIRIMRKAQVDEVLVQQKSWDKRPFGEITLARIILNMKLSDPISVLG